MNESDLQAIEGRANAATAGPWECTHREGYAPYESAVWSVPLEATREFTPEITAITDKDDAEFIAHARTDVPALIAHIRELEKAVHCLDVEVARARTIAKEATNE